MSLVFGIENLLSYFSTNVSQVFFGISVFLGKNFAKNGRLA